MAVFTLFRDSLTIDQNIAATAGIQASPGDLLLLGARQCTLSGLSANFNYEIAADKLVVTAPSIVLSGSPNNPSPEVTIAAVEINGALALQSQAMAGERGADGADGANAVRVGKTIIDPPEPGDPGEPGGPGSPGGRAIIHYVRAAQPISAAASGGAGGTGGHGGKGGLGGAGVPNAANGANGSPGAHGAPGTAEAKQVDITQLWNTLDPEFEVAWAEFRGASITIWNRIEPRSRAQDLRPGLEARLFDPLWLLTRQWQLGEFAGRDAGSPLTAAVTTTTAPVDRYAAGSSKGQKYDGIVPLETFVEREAVRPARAAGDLRQAAEAGLHFARLLDAATLSRLRPAYLTQYPLAASAGDAVGLSSVVAGRVIDGIALRADLVAAGTKLPAAPPISDADTPLLQPVIQSWLAWYAVLFSEPSQPMVWSEDRMEYNFVVGVPGDTGSLAAREYDGGTVDWYIFDRSTATLTGGAGKRATTSRNLVASPVSFRGMPARRYWEIEDGSVDLGALSAAPEDLGRLLLREFALIYGTEWFVVPVSVPWGCIVNVDALKVSDTFGLVTVVPHYSAADGASVPWRLFAISPDERVAGAAPDYRLAILPSSAATLDSESFENVLLLRDEMADMVWGVERRALGPAGVSVDRALAWKTAAPPPSPPTASGAPRYRLGSDVPDYWIPFVPVLVDGGPPNHIKSLRFRRGTMPTPSSAPLGAFLSPNGPTLFPEEVPREGVQLDRRFRYARGVDGSTYLWVARLRSTGLGEGRSGLEYDFLE
jgi:hypothetical protein